MFRFERKTILPEELDQGPLPHRFLGHAWLIWSVALLSCIYFLEVPATQALYLSITAIILARLAAFDLCYFILLNIYTLPLIPLGVLYHILFTEISAFQSFLGALIAGGLGLMAAFIAYKLKGVEAFGMGDVKLMAALGAWVGVTNLPLAFSVAFTLNLALSFFTPRNQPIPFGVGLVVGLWLFVTLKAPIHTILHLIP